MKTEEIYQKIAQMFENILKGLQQNPENWERPWILSENGILAHNAQTKHIYSGINQLLLSQVCYDKGYSVNRWVTYKQVSELRALVRKGEKASEIVFLSTVYQDKITRKYLSEQEVKLMSNEQLEDIIKRSVLRYYNVFNVAQVDNLPLSYTSFYKENLKPFFNIIEQGEKILENSKAVIELKQADQAYYSPASDKITLPLKEQFKSNFGFYETAFHELGHWTGHHSRLNRPLLNFFGSVDYAREELTAEMCAVFTCASIGIEFDMRNSARYVDAWLGKLREDNRAFVNAIMQAQSAANYLIVKNEDKLQDNELVA